MGVAKCVSVRVSKHKERRKKEASYKSQTSARSYDQGQVRHRGRVAVHLTPNIVPVGFPTEPKSGRYEARGSAQGGGRVRSETKKKLGFSVSCTDGALPKAIC